MLQHVTNSFYMLFLCISISLDYNCWFAFICIWYLYCKSILKLPGALIWTWPAQCENDLKFSLNFLQQSINQSISRATKMCIDAYSARGNETYNKIKTFVFTSLGAKNIKFKCVHVFDFYVQQIDKSLLHQPRMCGWI